METCVRNTHLFEIGKHCLGFAAIPLLAGCAFLSDLGNDALPTATLGEPLADRAGASDPVAMTDSLPPLAMDRVVPPDAIVKAVEHPDRPDGDRALDDARKPAGVMAFAGIAEGQTILEMAAGDGYFTELLARAVGPRGRVYMQNPPTFEGFVDDTVSNRLAGRLTNVTVMKTGFDRLPLPERSVDRVTWFQGPHALWVAPKPSGEPGDPGAVFGAIYSVLKPGGRFVVLDHRAPTGSPPETAGQTHRLDPATVVEIAMKAGFVVAGESDLLRSDHDDLALDAFDEQVRGRTDQFLIAFERP